MGTDNFEISYFGIKLGNECSILPSEKIDQNQKVSKQIAESFDSILSILDRYDSCTQEHQKRVANLSYLLANKLKESGKFDQVDDIFLKYLKIASLIHDIGKIEIRDTILKKPGKLTDEEFEEMTFHTNIGAFKIGELEKLHGKKGILKMAKIIALYHHEKWDGSGYPERLAGEEIPLPARIMALVDVFDALKSPRPYKEAFNDEKTYKIIQESMGIHFDPNIAQILLDNWDEFLFIRN